MWTSFHRLKSWLAVNHEPWRTHMKRLLMFLLGLTMLALPVLDAFAQDMSPKALQQRMVERRAVDAVIWGLPLVGEDAVKQAYFRDGKATYNDIVWWPKGGGWKNQSP